MKKVGIINQPISSVISGLGHTDTITIADAGLPIPAATRWRSQIFSLRVLPMAFLVVR